MFTFCTLYAWQYQQNKFKNEARNMTFHCEVREKTNKMQQLDVYYQHFLNMFLASLCPSSGEQDVCYCTWCAVL